MSVASAMVATTLKYHLILQTRGPSQRFVDSSDKLGVGPFILDASGLDIVIANAGVADHDHLKSGDAVFINNILHTNILGVTNTVLPVIPYMKEHNKGKIVIIKTRS